MSLRVKLVSAFLAMLAISRVCSGQAQQIVNLWPENIKPKTATKSLISTLRCIKGDTYQVFSLRNNQKHEVFRLLTGYCDKGKPDTNPSAGILVDADMNHDGKLDFIWTGTTEEFTRLLWFMSKDAHYECIDLLKTAEIAWQKKFGGDAPDFSDVGPDYLVDEVLWDWRAKILTLMIGPNDEDHSKSDDVMLKIGPSEFVSDTRY